MPAFRISSWPRACSWRRLEVLDLSKESEAARKLYGLDNPVTASYGMRCLMARRLVEAGVRFVQVPVQPRAAVGPSQQHKTGNAEVRAEDRSGRGRAGKGPEEPRPARQHHRDVGRRIRPLADHAERRRPRPQPQRLHLWFAGGGFKKGFVYGETDEFGYKAVVNRVSVPI